MNILIIGLGNMGGAIAQSLNDNHNLYGIDPNLVPNLAGKNSNVSHGYSFPIFSHIEDASTSIDEHIEVIVLTVKPQISTSILESLKSHLSKNTLVISSIAGIEISSLVHILNTTRIARIMPTIAAKKKESLTALAFHPSLNEEAKNMARTVSSAIGMVLEIAESHMSAITGLSGSGIAFVASFIDALSMAGVREGISYSDAYTATLQTVKGALSLLQESGLDSESDKSSPSYNNPNDFIKAVCSPGGTTIEGIQALHQHGFYDAIFQAVHAAKNKSDMLSKNNKQ